MVHVHLANSPAPAHTCLAAWPSRTLLPSQNVKEGSCFVRGGHYCPFSWEHSTEQQLALVLSLQRGINEEAWVSKKSQHVSVIALTWTKLTCADRWKWSKARITVLGARRGSEWGGMPRCMEQSPRVGSSFSMVVTCFQYFWFKMRRSLLPSFKTVSEGGFSPVKDNICDQSHVPCGLCWVPRLKEGGILHILAEGCWSLPFLSWFEIPQTFREALELMNLWWYEGRGGDTGRYWISSGFARRMC